MTPPGSSCPAPRPGLRAACVALLGSLLLACSDGGQDAGDPASRVGRFHGEGAPTVVLVSLDTTRADRLGSYGSRSGATPFLDRRAEQGLVFERAWATNPITLPSHATMLTGVWPSQHGIEDNGVFTLSEEAETLPEVLAAEGFRTGAFVGTFILSDRRGLAQGFEDYDSPRPWAGGPMASSHRPASEVVDAAERWIETVEPDEPLFVWVHFYDPHLPREVLPEYAERFEDLYDAEIAFCDDQVRRLDQILERRGRQRALWMLTADHGESLGEHGEKTHGAFVYEGAMRIPLIVAGEGVPAGRSSAPVSLTDLAPTVLDFLDLDGALPHSAGRSLLGPLPPESEREIYLETFLGYHSYRWHWEQALVHDGHKLIVGKRRELYSLADDPAEQFDRSRDEPERVAAMEGRLQAFLEQHRALGWSRTEVASDQDLLESLGYVVGGTGEREESESLPDPRDQLLDLQLHDQVREHIQGGLVLLGQSGMNSSAGLSPGRDPDERIREGRRRLGLARRLLEELHESNPLDPYHPKAMGQVEVALGRYSEATSHLETALLQNPGDSMSRFHLANAYAGTGHPDWARLEIQKAISLQPKFVLGCRWLLRDHLQQEEYGRAAWWLAYLREQVPGIDEDGLLDPIAEAVERGRAASGEGLIAPEHFPLEDRDPEGVRRR